MPLVSSLYGLAPSTPYVIGEEERDRRLRRAMRRLLGEFGLDEVVRRIRLHDGGETMKAWLVLTAYAEDKRNARLVG